MLSQKKTEKKSVNSILIIKLIFGGRKNIFGRREKSLLEINERKHLHVLPWLKNHDYAEAQLWTFLNFH